MITQLNIQSEAQLKMIENYKFEDGKAKLHEVQIKEAKNQNVKELLLSNF